MPFLPQDEVILLSYVNTKLRDTYPTLYDFCEHEEISVAELCTKLERIGYEYNLKLNQFI